MSPPGGTTGSDDLAIVYLSPPSAEAASVAAAVLDGAGLTGTLVVPRDPRRSVPLGTTGCRVVDVLPLGAPFVLRRSLAITSAPVIAVSSDGAPAAGLAAAVAEWRHDQAPAALGSTSLAGRDDWERLLQRGLPPPGATFSDAVLGLLLEDEVHPAESVGAPSGAGRSAAGRSAAWRTAAATVRRRVRGRLSRPARSPLHVLALAPESVREVIGTADVSGLPQSPPPRSHLVYRMGRDRILHVYAHPPENVRRALGDREAIRKDTGVSGIPRVHAVDEGTAALWVVEDFLPGGPPPPGRADTWLPRALAWLSELAGDPGPPLRSTVFWPRYCDEALTAVEAGQRDAIAYALRRVETLPSRPMHGDLRPLNVHLDGGRIGVIDWEGAWRYGMPGLDAVYLAMLARSGRPDPNVVAALVSGTPGPGASLVDLLRHVGITADLLPSALLTMLAVWSAGGARRARSGQARSAEGPYARLLLEWAVPLDRLQRDAPG